MIPKIIHYCWFGGKPLPELARRCIASWRKYLPEYEIRQWNESNYDVRKIPFMAEAYDDRRFAFVSDYARFDILYREGGVYFDTDVEVIRPLDDILAAGPFMALERAIPFLSDGSVAPRSYRGHGLAVAAGLGLACAAGHPLYRAVLDAYARVRFKDANGTHFNNVVAVVSDLLMARGLKLHPGILQIEGIRIYPVDYFCPQRPDGRLTDLTDNTRCIHHYAASWYGFDLKLFFWLRAHFGNRVATLVNRHFLHLNF